MIAMVPKYLFRAQGPRLLRSREAGGRGKVQSRPTRLAVWAAFSAVLTRLNFWSFWLRAPNLWAG